MQIQIFWVEYRFCFREMSTLMRLLDVRLSSIVLGTILHGESSFFRPLQQPVSTLVYTDPCTVEILGFGASLTPILHVYKNLIMFRCLGFGVKSGRHGLRLHWCTD